MNAMPLSTSRLAAGVVLVLAGIAPAAANVWADERVRLNGGAFFPSADIEVQYNPESGRGTNINLTDELDNDEDSQVFRGGAAFRLGSRHRLFIDYFKVSTDGETTSTRDLVFGNIEIPAGSGVASEFSIATTQAGYMYSFVQNDTIELAGVLAVAYTEIDAELAAFLAGSQVDRESADASGPVPVLGLNLGVALGEQWKLRANLQGISADIDSYDGTYYTYGAGIEWSPWRQFGLGLGYGGVHGDLDVDDSNWSGSLDLEIHGPFGYLTVGF
jgi:opacity protein-like surface antigen